MVSYNTCIIASAEFSKEIAKGKNLIDFDVYIHVGIKGA
jgi:hypothetical protein